MKALTLNDVANRLQQPSQEKLLKLFPKYQSYNPIIDKWDEESYNRFWSDIYINAVYRMYLEKDKVYDDNWINPNRKKKI